MQSNKSQQLAITHRDGPMLVLAGPGSGKTTVITRRIEYLIKEAGVNPANILVITFTKAAAIEMKERFYKLCSQADGGYRNVTFGTFHAVFFTILKHAYNLSASNIIKDEERYAIVKAAVAARKLDVEDEREFVGNVLGEIGKVKSEQVNLDNYYSVNCPSDAFREIFREYTETLKKNRRIDFEDMLVYTYELLTAREDILRAWQNKYKYILIDEFQDINKIQYDTIRLLAAPENNLFIVGDDDQSIYGFRGSKPDIMLNFDKDYKGAKRVVLDVNYRSTPQIMEAAGRVIQFNTKRYKKNIITNRSEGMPVSVQQVKDFMDEYTMIAESIRWMNSSGTSYDEIAVLYRTEGGIASLVRKLMEAGIPFRIKDKLPDVFEHWIAMDIFAYIRLACGVGNRADFIRICNKPKRYIGRDYLTDAEIDLDRLCAYYEDKQWMVERIEKLKSDFDILAKLNPYAAVNYIRRGIGYDDFLNEYAAGRNIRIEELMEVVNEIHESAREHNTFAEWEQAIREYRNKVKEAPGDKDTPMVTLTTMHSSKGLEFDNVFIVDVNEGVCPHRKAVLDTDIEEERRMLYVAMTRARKELYIYSTMERYNKNLEVSRFLIESGLYKPHHEEQSARRAHPFVQGRTLKK